MAGGIKGTDKSTPKKSLREIYQHALAQKCDVALWMIKIGTYLHREGTSTTTLFLSTKQFNATDLISKAGLSKFMNSDCYVPPAKTELQLRAIEDYVDSCTSAKERQAMYHTLLSIAEQAPLTSPEFYQGERKKIINAMHDFAASTENNTSRHASVIPVLVGDYLKQIGLSEVVSTLLSSPEHEENTKKIIDEQDSYSAAREALLEYVAQISSDMIQQADLLSLELSTLSR